MEQKSTPVWRVALNSVVYVTLAYLGPPVGGYWLDRALGLLSILLYPLNLLGLIPLAVGLLLIGWSGRYLVTVGRGTPQPQRPPLELVRQGPYQYVRNPMTVGLFFVQTGLALVLGLVTTWLLIALEWILMHTYTVYIEEPELERRFGQSYLQYKNEVGRWIPSLRKRK